MAVSAAPFALKNLPAGLDAEQLRQALASVVPDGGGLVQTGDLAVTQTATPSLGVLVGTGRAWLPGTNVANLSGETFSTQGQYFALNDAPYTVNLSTANATNPRIDLIYIGVQDTAYGGAADKIVIDKVTGTPAASPAVPALPKNSIALAQVSVAANATSVTNANITSLASSGLFRPGQVASAVSPNATYWTAAGALTGIPLVGAAGYTMGWNGYVQLTRASTTLALVSSSYTDLGTGVIPAAARCSWAQSQYVRGILTGAGILQPCTVFVNYQNGDVMIRPDANVTMAVGSLVAFQVSYQA
jgi:hypothetical protein